MPATRCSARPYRPLALRQLMNLLAARLRACAAQRLHALRQRQRLSARPHRAGLGKHHQTSLPGLVKGPPPLSFLLQSAGDPLIEAFQPLLLGPFLSIERAQRLSRVASADCRSAMSCAAGHRWPRLLAFDHHAGVPRLGGLQGGLCRRFARSAADTRSSRRRVFGAPRRGADPPRRARLVPDAWFASPAFSRRTVSAAFWPSSWISSCPSRSASNVLISALR